MSVWYNRIYCEDALQGLTRIPDGTIDLVVTDPPYGLGKDYGNDSDKLATDDYLHWMEKWIDMALPKLKMNGSLYIFLTWRYSPEIFVMLKQRMTMINEIIWDRRVPSMGGSTRRFSSVHDTIGFFAKSKDYYFDIDAVRIPYDVETKKARSRSIFVGAKWLEMGYNPKDLWSVSRLHREHRERTDHPTQKPLEIIERMIRASCPIDGVVLDPFMGSGTTAVGAKRCERNFVGFELNPLYCDLIQERLKKMA
jgi:site-specific DNA-methyltransferase (adenine-specific)